MSGTLRLVVARHEEELGWLRAVDKKWHRSVVTKGIHVPNTGREASSYLWAMEQYREDDGWTCFVQGDPFDHYPELMTVLNRAAAYPQQFVPLSQRFAVTDENGAPHHEGLPVKEWFEAMIAPWPGNLNLRFAPGAQFLVPSWILRGRTLEEIRAARELCDTTDVGAHTMERLWNAWLVF